MATGYSIRHKGDTKANLELANKIIPERELVVERDTNRLKVGDGLRGYKDLPYIGEGGGTNNISSLNSTNSIVVGHGATALERGTELQAALDKHGTMAVADWLNIILLPGDYDLPTGQEFTIKKKNIRLFSLVRRACNIVKQVTSFNTGVELYGIKATKFVGVPCAEVVIGCAIEDLFIGHYEDPETQMVRLYGGGTVYMEDFVGNAPWADGYVTGIFVTALNCEFKSNSFHFDYASPKRFNCTNCIFHDGTLSESSYSGEYDSSKFTNCTFLGTSFGDTFEGTGNIVFENCTFENVNTLNNIITIIMNYGGTTKYTRSRIVNSTLDGDTVFPDNSQKEIDFFNCIDSTGVFTRRGIINP